MMDQRAISGFYDIYPIKFVPFWRTIWFVAMIGALAVFVLGTALFFFWRWYRLRRTPVTAWDEALAKLAKLESYINQQQPRLFYQELTMILKQYLSRRYEQVLDDKTDEEVATFIATVTLPADIQHKVHDLFKGAVAHKFAYNAHNTLPPDAMKRVLQEAVLIIEATRTQMSNIES